MDSSREDIKKLINYRWKSGLTIANSHKEIDATLKLDTVSIHTCSDSVRKFREGKFKTTDEECTGRLPINYSAQIQAILDEDRLATVALISAQFAVPRGTICSQLLKTGKRYLSNSWLPHALADANKQKTVDVCCSQSTLQAAEN